MLQHIVIILFAQCAQLLCLSGKHTFDLGSSYLVGNIDMQTRFLHKSARV